MAINYNKKLKIIIEDYFSHIRNKKIFFCDVDCKYSSIEFISKVINYKNELKKIWKNQKNNLGVGILLERNIDYIAMIFATWLSGGYYVPLSLSSPEKNTKYQIFNSKVSLIVKKDGNKIIFKKILNKNKIRFKTKDFDIAYIIFTSGSTGQKKGVLIKKSSFISYINNLKKSLNTKVKPKSILINGEMTFDISLADIAFAFNFNASLSVTNDSRNLISLISMLNEYKINSLYVVPSTLKRIVHFCQLSKIIKFSNVTQINIGGELLSYDLAKSAKKIFKKANFYNFYGPTEFTINATFHKINFNKKNYLDNNVPIGKPLSNNKFILKKTSKKNKYGELLLSGDQLMGSYTNAKNPFVKINRKIYYKTGDLVNIDKNNDIYFISRKNSYIKHLGYRINLDHIEKIISKLTNTDCKIIHNKNQLFALLKSKSKINVNLILNKIKLSLENYEIPNKFIFLKDFLYSSSGKVDLKKLSKKYLS